MSILLALEPLARTSEGSKSGPIGLGIILLLCIACYFLFKSMSKHLRTVREDFPKTVPPVPPASSEPPPATVVPRSAARAEPVQRADTEGDTPQT